MAHSLIYRELYRFYFISYTYNTIQRRMYVILCVLYKNLYKVGDDMKII